MIEVSCLYSDVIALFAGDYVNRMCYKQVRENTPHHTHTHITSHTHTSHPITHTHTHPYPPSDHTCTHTYTYKVGKENRRTCICVKHLVHFVGTASTPSFCPTAGPSTAGVCCTTAPLVLLPMVAYVIGSQSYAQ